MTRIVSVISKEAAAKYAVRISYGSLAEIGKQVNSISRNSIRKLAIVSNKTVFDLYGSCLLKSLSKSGFETAVYLIGEGERHKNFRTIEKIVDFLVGSRISRSDGVIGLGGGVVGDAAGFASSIYLRGVTFIQVPTTLLAMIDSSVGGKTGVNVANGKNLVGSFYQPRGVFVDPSVLATLPTRELTSGLCEAVKQRAIEGSELFERTHAIVNELGRSKTLESFNKAFGKRFESFIAAQIEFKARIVSGDERESVRSSSKSSRKILNFGHTFAHALEAATDYRRLRHGEAVGYGIMFAATLSKKLGLLDTEVVNLLRDVVLRSGRLPSIKNIDQNAILKAIRFDKKNIDGSLQWVLLEGIGKPHIVPHQMIGDQMVLQTVREFDFLKIASHRLFVEQFKMKNKYFERPTERGGAGVKFLVIAILIVLLANAGYNYVPVAYEGASFRQEMDTAVVKGLAASGQLKPTDVVKAHIQHAAKDYNIPAEALIEIRPAGSVIQAHASYSKSVNMLPFGLYKYQYQFNHIASPTGYLTKQ